MAIGFNPLEKNSKDDILTVMETNINGFIYMTQAILPRMKERNSGDIINIGSIAGMESTFNPASKYLTANTLIQEYQLTSMETQFMPVQNTQWKELPSMYSTSSIRYYILLKVRVLSLSLSSIRKELYDTKIRVILIRPGNLKVELVFFIFIYFNNFNG